LIDLAVEARRDHALLDAGAGALVDAVAGGRNRASLHPDALLAQADAHVAGIDGDRMIVDRTLPA
jgi:hypothetical protein